MEDPGKGSGAGKGNSFPGVKLGSGVPGLGQRREGYRNSRTAMVLVAAGTLRIRVAITCHYVTVS